MNNLFVDKIKERVYYEPKVRYKSDAKIPVESPRLKRFKIDEYIRPFDKGVRKIKSVQLKIKNIDKWHDDDISNGTGFDITNPVDFDEKKGVRTMDGIFSPKFGVDIFNDSNTDDMYKCECGNLTTPLHENEICPECHTPVKCVDSHLDMHGYIPLGDFVVINPAFYKILEKFIGRTAIKKILEYSNRYDKNGQPVDVTTKKDPFAGIGMIAFHERYDEIIEYYHKVHKTKVDEYDMLSKKKNFKKIFTHYVPVYTALLRPRINDGSKMHVFEVNESYTSIIQNSLTLRKPSFIDKRVIFETSLREIQTEFNKICNDTITDVFTGKGGLIRSKLISTRNNFTSRIVITPGIGLKCDEIALPYLVGVEQFRPLLVNLISKYQNVNLRQANIKVDNAIRKFDHSIWLLINHIVSNSSNPPMMMIQRSPSLLMESMRLMRIKYFKSDYYDLTAELPAFILDGMNADYDGDNLAFNTIYDNRLKLVWGETYSPVNHFISRYTGDYSDTATFIKDSAVTLYNLWEAGKNETYYKYWAPESEKAKQINRLEN